MSTRTISWLQSLVSAALCALIVACGNGDGAGGHDHDTSSSSSPDAGEAPDEACQGQLECACAADSPCDPALVCDPSAQRCRARLSCADVACEVHRACVDTGEGDARCGECEEGYRWDAVQRRCDVVASCNDADPGSVVQGCAAENRSCDDGGETAQCGDCLSGTTLVNGRCTAADCTNVACPSPQRCAEGQAGASCTACIAGFRWDEQARRCAKTCDVVAAACHSDEHCVEGEGGRDASCARTVACPEGEVDNGRGACVFCGRCYERVADGVQARDGVVGIANGGVAYAGQCVCDVEQNYFQSLTGEVLSCDADHDGFQNRRATLLAGTPFQNACTTNVITKFTLVSDDLVADSSRDVAAALDVPVESVVDRFDIADSAWMTLPMGDASVMVMALVEDEALDELGKFRDRYDDPAAAFALRSYGGGSVTFRPEHANPLTKVCNHDNDDFNMDGIPDVVQAQGMAASGTRPPQLAGFASMSYFVELAAGAFESTGRHLTVDGRSYSVGQYVIRERSRAQDGDGALPFALDASSERARYEHSCMRSRDAAFPGLPGALVGAEPGFDFASWQCSEETPSGGCHTGGSSGHVAYDGRTPRYAGAIEAYATSENGGVPIRWDVPPDAPLSGQGQRWPGMNHHSQFKCVTSDPRASPYRRLDALGGSWDHFGCTLASAGEAGASPDWSCTRAQQAPVGNHWAVARYQPYEASHYVRGCIDEKAEWDFACPAWEARWGEDRRAFTAERLQSGRFTCQGGCARQGVFLVAESGTVCCYGQEGLQCTYENYSSDAGHTLLCAPDDESVPPTGVELCTVALGEFTWAREPADPDDAIGLYDPNVLKWGPASNEAFQHSTWE